MLRVLRALTDLWLSDTTSSFDGADGKLSAPEEL